MELDGPLRRTLLPRIRLRRALDAPSTVAAGRADLADLAQRQAVNVSGVVAGELARHILARQVYPPDQILAMGLQDLKVLAAARGLPENQPIRALRLELLRGQAPQRSSFLETTEESSTEAKMATLGMALGKARSIL